MTNGRGLVSIWFFIGVLLFAYGILILSSGVYQYYNPPIHDVVLGNLHAGVWWGAFLLVLGAFYTYQFFPRRNK